MSWLSVTDLILILFFHMGIKVILNIAASYILPGRTLSSTGHIWSCASTWHCDQRTLPGKVLFTEPPHYGQVWWWWKVADEWGKWSWTDAFCGACCDVNLDDNDAGEKTSLHHIIHWAMWFHRKTNNKWGWNNCLFVERHKTVVYFC